MERFFGQFQTISCRHKRGQVGSVRVCIENVICNGAFVESYVELERPADMYRLGRIKRGTWLTWLSSRVGGAPRYIQVLIGEQPQLEAIANEVPFAGAGNSDVVAMFLKGYKPPADELVYEPSVPTNPVSDMFLKGYKHVELDGLEPDIRNTAESLCVTEIIYQTVAKGM
jgi:hypothetical protein